MNSKVKSLASLIWVVFVDSMGWGIAFSVFALLLLNNQSTFLSGTISDTSRYMIYEVLLAIYSVFMFFFAPVLGGIADRYGRKPALNISMLGLTLGFILCAGGCYLHSIWLLLLGRIISGITAGSLSVAQAAAVDLSTEKTKAFYLSILMMANCLGFSLGPVLGDLLVFKSSIPLGTLTFLIGAFMSIVGFLSIVFFFKDSFVPAEITSKLDLSKDFLNIKIAFCKPVLSNYLYVLLFSMLAFGLFFSNIPIFLSRAFAEQSISTGSILSFEAVIFSFALMFGGKYLFHRIDKIKIILITLFVQLLAYLFMSFGFGSFVLYLVLFTVISVFAGLMYIALLTLISDVTASDWQGRVMGVVAALSSITWGIGPLLSGGLNHYFLGLSFLFATLLIFVSLFNLYFFSGKRSLLNGSKKTAN